MTNLAQFTRSAVQQALNALERKLGVNPIPGLRDTDRLALLRYLRPIQEEAKNVGFGVGSFDTGGTFGLYPYRAGVYSPTQNRIYLVPSGQSDEANWHYINCYTGELVAYAHGAGVLPNYGYQGGAYSPTQDRIYFAPFSMSTQANWHYLDCKTGDVVAYPHGSLTLVANAYLGAVYSPTQNRIYLCPNAQATQSKWHYIDCENGNVVEYDGVIIGPVGGYYAGGVYSPTQNRIYLVPSGISSEGTWHYIDCDTGALVAYQNNIFPPLNASAYSGGVYSPTQDRIYLVPAGQGPESEWHYIDCDSGNVVAYDNGLIVPAVSAAYAGGCYSPAENRIYMAPNFQGEVSTWHYIDCDDGGVVEYETGSTPADPGYTGCVFSPTENRVYMIAYYQPSVPWIYVEEYSDVPVSRNVMAGALFNKF